MKVQELRVGNSIKINGVVVTVDERTIFDFNYDSRVKEGVPLNKELLKDMGCFQHPFFKETRLCLPKFEDCGVDLQLSDSDGVGFVLWLVSDGDFEGKAIKIVREFHELQNAFHVFTGQELTLKF